MAYKNKKKNAQHQKEIRKKTCSSKKYCKQTRYERTHPKETEREAMIRIGKQLGML